VAELTVEGADLVLHLSPLQKLASFHADVRAPLTAVRSVSVVEKPWLALRGRRLAGTVMRGVTAMGTWSHSGGEFDFCVVRREQVAVQVELNTGRFVRWLVGVTPGTDAAAEADRVASAAGIRRS
jgi:hypothetical protein